MASCGHGGNGLIAGLQRNNKICGVNDVATTEQRRDETQPEFLAMIQELANIFTPSEFCAKDTECREHF
jgi:hypothetical protein